MAEKIASLDYLTIQRAEGGYIVRSLEREEGHRSNREGLFAFSTLPETMTFARKALSPKPEPKKK